jgi:hypothetical protein
MARNPAPHEPIPKRRRLNTDSVHTDSVQGDPDVDPKRTLADIEDHSSGGESDVVVESNVVEDEYAELAAKLQYLRTFIYMCGGALGSLEKELIELEAYLEQQQCRRPPSSR